MRSLPKRLNTTCGSSKHVRARPQAGSEQAAVAHTLAIVLRCRPLLLSSLVVGALKQVRPELGRLQPVLDLGLGLERRQPRIQTTPQQVCTWACRATPAAVSLLFPTLLPLPQSSRSGTMTVRSLSLAPCQCFQRAWLCTVAVPARLLGCAADECTCMLPRGTTISHAAFQLCTLHADVRIEFNPETVAFAAFVEAARTGATEGESKAAAGPAPANSSGATEDESKAAAGPAPANSSGAGAARIAAAEHIAAAAAHFAAALRSMCVDLAAIVARKPAEEPSPDCDINGSVWEIEHVRNTAARVLSASVCTPAGILLSALLKVGAKPNDELDSGLLLIVEAYITTTAPDSWKKEPTQTHARDALGVASTLTNKRIRNWRRHEGELTLECLQVGPIVRRPLEAVFKLLHGYVCVCVRGVRRDERWVSARIVCLPVWIRVCAATSLSSTPP